MNLVEDRGCGKISDLLPKPNPGTYNTAGWSMEYDFKHDPDIVETFKQLNDYLVKREQNQPKTRWQRFLKKIPVIN